jgi:hypothetical protein
MQFLQQRRYIFPWSPCGIFISNTMIVMTMAITPSLNASNRPLLSYSPIQNAARILKAAATWLL